MVDKKAALERARMRAQCIVQSWLGAWGIPFKHVDGYLVVRKKTVGFYTTSPTDADVNLHVGALLARNFDKSMAQVEKLMKAIGRKAPTPPRRPSGEPAAADDYMARSMRLSLFNQTPNPPVEAMVVHHSTVKREADRARRRFRDIGERMGLETRDYYTLGLVFLTIYLHRFQDLHNAARNGANLTLFLHQCFSRWAKVTYKDLRSISVDVRGVQVHQVMATPVPGATLDWGTEEPSYTIPEYYEPAVDAAEAVPMDPRVARAAVTKALDEMDHDVMVEKLAGIMRSPYLDADTRRAATLRYNRHLTKCAACRTANEAWQHVQVTHSKYAETR